MRAVDQVGVPLLQMTEHAGRVFTDEATSPADGPITLLVDSGGNGGGGLCTAQHLLDPGHIIRVVLSQTPNDLSGAAATRWQVLQAMRTEPVDVGDLDVVVDALVG